MNVILTRLAYLKIAEKWIGISRAFTSLYNEFVRKQTYLFMTFACCPKREICYNKLTWKQFRYKLTKLESMKWQFQNKNTNSKPTDSKYMNYFFLWNLRPESKQEPVKTEMGPPPSPASTCSDASSIASSASMPYSKLHGRK